MDDFDISSEEYFTFPEDDPDTKEPSFSLHDFKKWLSRQEDQPQDSRKEELREEFKRRFRAKLRRRRRKK